MSTPQTSTHVLTEPIRALLHGASKLLERGLNVSMSFETLKKMSLKNKELKWLVNLLISLCDSQVSNMTGEPGCFPLQLQTLTLWADV